ncbi:MAG: sigma 54-interacting transcriptional regulator [Deltaproteobacteria bacterium]|nr:sigma 54-interacting transcriptional regulator [Deltaproteobacteria bacterium]
MAKKTVLLGFLGTTLDRGPNSARRWEQWRPSISLCQHQDLLVDRYELLFDRRFTTLATRVSEDIIAVSPETVVVPRTIQIKDPWDFEEVYAALLDFARAYPWDTETEHYLLHITTGTHVAQICLFLLAEARYFPAQLIQSSPPSRESAEKAQTLAGEYRIIDLDLSRYDKIASRFNKATKDDVSFLKSGIETRNKKFNELIERIERVALASKAPILLLGPTGAGKSQLARKIFELKRSRNQLGGKFINVNCATIRGDGAMSTLFGHTKGSFTGAANARDGLLLSAHGGMLFLDEIAELGLDEQAMLLRAIEEKLFFPVGADKEVSSEFQLIAGTNRDLQSAVKAGTFREDLLARINLWCFQLPGLKDRPEDIAPNIAFELERYSQKNNARVSFNKEAHELFLKFATSSEATWGANFRDLNAAVTRMGTLAESGRIAVPNVEDELARLRAAWRASTSDLNQGTSFAEHIRLPPALAETLDEFDRVQLVAVLRICAESKTLSEAGRKLFAVSRQGKSNFNDADRLRKYLARFGIDWRSAVGA